MIKEDVISGSVPFLFTTGDTLQFLTTVMTWSDRQVQLHFNVNGLSRRFLTTNCRNEMF